MACGGEDVALAVSLALHVVELGLLAWAIINSRMYRRQQSQWIRAHLRMVQDDLK